MYLVHKNTTLPSSHKHSVKSRPINLLKPMRQHSHAALEQDGYKSETSLKALEQKFHQTYSVILEIGRQASCGEPETRAQLFTLYSTHAEQLTARRGSRLLLPLQAMKHTTNAQCSMLGESADCDYLN